MKTIANSCTWGPHIAGHLEKMGVCQLAPNGPIINIVNNFFIQNPKLKGVSCMEKLPTPVFGAPHCGPFRQKRGLPMGPEWTNFKTISTISGTKSRLQWSPFYHKNCQLMYSGLHNVGCFEQMGVPANRPKMDQFCIFVHFLVQNQKSSRGIFYGKN